MNKWAQMSINEYGFCVLHVCYQKRWEDIGKKIDWTCNCFHKWCVLCANILCSCKIPFYFWLTVMNNFGNWRKCDVWFGWNCLLKSKPYLQLRRMRVNVHWPVPHYFPSIERNGRLFLAIRLFLLHIFCVLFPILFFFLANHKTKNH